MIVPQINKITLILFTPNTIIYFSPFPIAFLSQMVHFLLKKKKKPVGGGTCPSTQEAECPLESLVSLRTGIPSSIFLQNPITFPIEFNTQSTHLLWAEHPARAEKPGLGLGDFGGPATPAQQRKGLTRRFFPRGYSVGAEPGFEAGCLVMQTQKETDHNSSRYDTSTL